MPLAGWFLNLPSLCCCLLLQCLALQTGNPEVVADLYAPDGVLLPTVSNQVRARVSIWCTQPFIRCMLMHIQACRPQLYHTLSKEANMCCHQPKCTEW